jgi:hypothetical protein
MPPPDRDHDPRVDVPPPPPPHDPYDLGPEPDPGAPPPPRGRPIDPASLFVILDGLRRAAPRELEQQVTNLVREFLLTLRSLIDWYLERLDHPDPEPRVEDIPID